MAGNFLTPEAQAENIRALMLAAGIGEDVASKRLAGRVLITRTGAALQLADNILQLLDRTLATSFEPSPGVPYILEVVIGNAAPRTSAPKIFVELDDLGCVISEHPLPNTNGAPCKLFVALAACYATGFALHRAIGRGLCNKPPDPMVIRFREFGITTVELMGPIDVGEAYLAGGGAIGNGLLWAASFVELHGRLHVADDDRVSSGNLQRQILFHEEDIGQPKATTLCSRAQPLMPHLNLIPAVCRLQNHPARTDGPWLRRLLVAVDSRRARRALQNELPYEVFDASTTAAKEIVVHKNTLLNGSACLGCVYARDEREISQDEAMAEHLGVSVADVRTDRITSEAAARICVRHPHLDVRQIEGLAFDTLYKALCSSGKLKAQTGERVIAPFAFVSALAGTLLLIELIRHLRRPDDVPTNEWRVSPWHPPFAVGRHLRSPNAECECCGRPVFRQVAREIWHGGRKEAAA